MILFDLVKFIGGPGSLVLFGVLCLVGGVIWRVWPRNPRLASGFFAAVGGLYVILALPVTAEGIDRLLPASSASQDAPSRIDRVVVFDGDNRRGRLATVLALWNVQYPQRLVVSGEPWLVDQLVDAGVPPARIERETISGTTREQVLWLAGTIKQQTAESVVLVASRLQVPRIEGLLEQYGVHIPVLAAPLDIEPATTSIWRFVPTHAALRLSRDAFYEYLALKYYRWRGWIGDGVSRSDSFVQHTSSVPAGAP